MTPFVANAVTGGDPNITPGQTAAIAGIATLTGGLFAGLAGQNAMAGATAAQNEALNNCLGHPESCLQMAKNTAAGVWNGAVNLGEVVANIPNGGPLASPGDPGYISLDGLRLPYTPGDQVGPATAFFTAALATDGVGGKVAADGEAETLATTGAANSGTTTIYRAVGPEELNDIASTGVLQNLGFGSQGKYFTTDPAAAASYAQQAVRAFGDPPYTMISTEVPSSLLELPGIQAEVDRGIPAFVIPNSSLPGLTPTIHNYFPIPPFRP